MPDRRTLLLTVLAMLAFAGNSLLCRAALKDTAIDAVSFTALRLFSGALMLAVLLHLRRRPATPARGGWRGAAALFVYAAAFSYAYVQLDAGTGALLLFGAVQVTLLLAGLLRGERLGGQALLGFLLALGGLLVPVAPRSQRAAAGRCPADAPVRPRLGPLYLLGRGGGDPLAVSAGNFLRALAFAALLLLAFHGQLRLDGAGLAYALLSGALASGLGYAVWYSALPGLTAIQGASVQLSVPVLAALCGALLLGEPLAHDCRRRPWRCSRRDRLILARAWAARRRRRLNQTEASRSSKWQSAVFSFISRTGLCIRYGQARGPAA